MPSHHFFLVGDMGTFDAGGVAFEMNESNGDLGLFACQGPVGDNFRSLLLEIACLVIQEFKIQRKFKETHP